MGIATKRVSVTTSAGGTQIVTTNTRRTRLRIKNIGTNDVWIGAGTTVTAGTNAATDGYKLPSGQELRLYCNEAAEGCRAIASTSATDVSVYEYVE